LASCLCLRYIANIVCPVCVLGSAVLRESNDPRGAFIVTTEPKVDRKTGTSNLFRTTIRARSGSDGKTDANFRPADRLLTAGLRELNFKDLGTW
jgi:hypothetical protein